MRYRVGGLEGWKLHSISIRWIRLARARTELRRLNNLMNAPEGLQEFLGYHRRMLAFMAGVCLAVAVLLLAILRNDPAWCGGFAAGAAAQLFKFGVLDIATIRRIAAADQGAALTQVRNMFLSLLVWGAAAALVLKMGWNVWAMAAGIFLPRIILLADARLRPNLFAPPIDRAGEERPEQSPEG